MMNKLMTVLVIMMMGHSAFAVHGDHIVSCVSKDGGYGIVQLFLQDSLAEGAKDFRVLGATVGYNYSATQTMSCSESYYRKDGSGSISCAGYYYNDDLTEITIGPEDGKIYVNWQTSQAYGSLKMKTECEIRKVPTFEFF